ncbi:MAG: hypothetical protein GY804_03960 [Alphaproteobacteria bacterium]|nr:hypothetical protein [Alphaproteobacteria bacterium]
MSFALTTGTYNYETILAIIAENPDGIGVAAMREEYGVHKEYDVLANIAWKGNKKQTNQGKEPHYMTIREEGIPLRFKITKSGKAHLKKFISLVQNDIPNIPLEFKPGFNEDGSKNEHFTGRSGGVRRSVTPKAKQQELIPIEEPIVLSSVAQRATEILQDVIASNHQTKTCLEEVHCTIAKFFEDFEENDYRTLRDGMLQEVIEETDEFTHVLEKMLSITTKTLVKATPPETEI